MSSPPPTMETPAMKATAKTRSPAGREASDIAAVIKAAERAGPSAGLSMKRRVPASVHRIAVVEVVVTEIVAIDDCSAVGDVGTVVINRPPAVPVVAPVMPAPA